MAFNSIIYGIFLVLIFIVYWFLLKKSIKRQNLLILGASCLFYGWWDWRFLLLIFFSIVLDFLLGREISKTDNQKRKKYFLAVSVWANLLLLGFFKYSNFFIESFIDASNMLGFTPNVSSLNIILPVGISFYTFQTLSYTIDVYRGKMKACNDFIVFAAYVSFFPQLVAGPIERARKLIPQFENVRVFSRVYVEDGLRQILWGLIKKVVIADNCATIVNQVFSGSGGLDGPSHWIGMIFFAFQIYGDFSGYSDIAIGSARLFGFNLSQNFAYPFFSRNYAEFWRRWHISLSTWFRDYFYIAVGGGKQKIRNFMLLFIISGMWHGASWNFIIWGALNGLLFLPSIAWKIGGKYSGVASQGRLFPTLIDSWRISKTFLSLCITYIFFRAKDLDGVLAYYRGLAVGNGSGSILNPESLLTLILILAFLVIEWNGRENQYAIEKMVEKQTTTVRWICYILLVVTLGAFAGESQQFVYFQF
ncbi:MBOAT family O-acyltransferase [Ekhidna sp.]